MNARLTYNDRFDDEPEEVSTGLRYVHGCEEAAGDGGFKPLMQAMPAVVETLGNLHIVGGNCDSPIEEQLGAFMLTVFREGGLDLKLCKDTEIGKIGNALILVPQYRWHHYRSDWAILRPADDQRALLVECDGKEFHSSAAQLQHDATKDAAAADYGHLTMRFTGSRIYRDPRGCARKVFDAWTGSNAA